MCPVDPGPTPKPPDGPPKLIKKLNIVFDSIKLSELIIIEIGIFLMLGMGFYNLSTDGYLGFSTKQWSLIWSFFECGIVIYLCLIPVILKEITNLIKFLIVILFIPHFIIQLVYHICAYGQKYIMTLKTWDDIIGCEMWIISLIGVILFGIYMFTKKK